MFRTESVRNRAWKQQKELEDYEKMERGGNSELKRQKLVRKNEDENRN